MRKAELRKPINRNRYEEKHHTKILLASALFASILLGGYSCATDDTLSELR